MYGDYYDWIVSSARPLGYSTAIHGISPLPVAPVELDKGLVKHKSFDRRNSGVGVQKRMMEVSAAKERKLVKAVLQIHSQYLFPCVFLRTLIPEIS